MQLDTHAIETARQQLVRDGFCIVDGMLPEGYLAHLRNWSDEWLGNTKHSAKWKYQGSDIHLGGIRHRPGRNPELPADGTVDVLIEHPQEIMAAMQLEDFRSGGTFQIISKPARAPALYWHQDWARWDDPVSSSPWPQQVFLNWYLTDTSAANGCLRVIPGSHHQRIDLHDHLVMPHEGGGYDIEETNEWMFVDHPQAVDIPVKAGQLVIADARLLHSTHPNQSDQRRTLLLGWFYRRTNDVPANWQGDVPEDILHRDPDLPFVFNRQPGAYLR
jgi:hypothetical protein